MVLRNRCTEYILLTLELFETTAIEKYAITAMYFYLLCCVFFCFRFCHCKTIAFLPLSHT